MGSLTRLDLTVVVLFLISISAIGLWMGRGEKGERDYFIAEHNVSWWAVLLSVVATETSALTFVSVPGLAYNSDFTFLQIALGYLVGRTVVAFFFLPRFFSGNFITVYGYLGKRFGLNARRFASILFLLTRTLADGVRVFATAIPLALIVGAGTESHRAQTIAVIVLSAFTWLYTYYGGMRAVIWTDVIQTGVYLFGALAALFVLNQNFPGGWSAIAIEASRAGKWQFFDFSLRFDKPYTLIAGLIGGSFLAMATHGTDQIIVQRLLASKNLKEAQRALIGSGIVVALQFLIFLTIGIGLFCFFHNAKFASPDMVFPQFISETMPSGIKGLILAGILSATMSSHSGALNSLAAATTHDIYLPLTKKKLSDQQLLPIARFFTLVWAIVLAITALSFRGQSASLVGVALSVASFTYGSLLGGFGLGLLNKNVQEKDALVGMTVGVLIMAFVAGTKSLGSAIAWPWYVLIGATVTVSVGNMTCWMRSKKRGSTSASLH